MRQPSPELPRRISRRALALAAGLLARPESSSAWCGGDFPGQLAWTEQVLPYVDQQTKISSEVLVRCVGGTTRRGSGYNILQNRVAMSLEQNNVNLSALAPVLVVLHW